MLRNKMGASIAVFLTLLLQSCSSNHDASSDAISNSTSISCQITAAPSSPSVGSGVEFSLIGLNGQPPYTFGSSLSGSEARAAVTTLSPTQASAVAQFSSAGVKRVEMPIVDRTGRFATCFTQITVRAPSLSLVACPTSSVQAGNNVMLTANVSNFLNTPSFTFSSTEPSIQITSSGNSASVASSNASAHDFTVTAVALDAATGDKANGEIHLSFTALPLNSVLTPQRQFSGSFGNCLTSPAVPSPW